MEILHFKELEDTHLVIVILWYASSDALPLYQILKQSAINYGDIAFYSLVLGEYQISMATYLKGVYM